MLFKKKFKLYKKKNKDIKMIINKCPKHYKTNCKKIRIYPVNIKIWLDKWKKILKINWNIVW